MTDLDDLATLIRSGAPLIAIETDDEARIVETFRHAIGKVWRPLHRWTITNGLERLDLDAEGREVPPDATATLMAIKGERERGVYLLCDFHPYLRYPMTLRLVREILAREGGSAPHTLVLIAPKLEDLPPEIDQAAVRYAPKLPDADALSKLVREEAFTYSKEHAGRRVTVDAKVLATIARNLVGLSLNDARRVARTLIHDDGALDAKDIAALGKAKFELLNRDGLLHYEFDTASFADVAGLARLKQWVAQRKAIFTGESKVGLDPPKGVLLLGVQGCGKSLAAKAIAGGFGVPLVRLDFGTLYNKYHGETERNLRGALSNAEALAPCVLWVDEIEKGLATSDSDDGISRRVLGYLLTWMAERKKPVFLVATANQVQQLPAELLRKGRFDEIFFVDLPDAATRAEILRLHLKKRKADVHAFDADALAAASDGFSGAELEQAIVAALYAAHAEQRDLAQAHVAHELSQTRPLSVLMAEQVEALREWARARTVPAN